MNQTTTSRYYPEERNRAYKSAILSMVFLLILVLVTVVSTFWMNDFALSLSDLTMLILVSLMCGAMGSWMASSYILGPDKEEEEVE